MRSALFKTFISNRLHERIRGGYRMARFLARKMQSVPIKINGHANLYVDLRELDDHALTLFRSTPLKLIPHEPGLTDVFHRLLRPDDIVFDVGANLGLHTLTFSKLAREVVAFEPNPSLVPNLRKTIKGIPNAKLFEICLSESDGTVDFHISDWDHMLGSIANWTGQPAHVVAVPARSLDSLIAEGVISEPQVLKVDVEGAEWLVFRGAEKLFSGSKAPRVVVFEELHSASRKLGIVDGAPAEYLRTKGYSLHLVEGDALLPLPDVRPTAANLVAIKTT